MKAKHLSGFPPKLLYCPLLSTKSTTRLTLCKRHRWARWQNSRWCSWLTSWRVSNISASFSLHSAQKHSTQSGLNKVSQFANNHYISYLVSKSAVSLSGKTVFIASSESCQPSNLSWIKYTRDDAEEHPRAPSLVSEIRAEPGLNIK